jgi:hypothetical protein
MHSYYKQRIFIEKDYDCTQGDTFYICSQDLKFLISVFIGVMNHFPPIKDIKNIVKISISLGHTLFPAMTAESHAYRPSFCNSPDLRFDLLDI